MGAIIGWALLVLPAWSAQDAELWLHLDAAQGAERLQVQVPYSWLEEDILAPTLQEQLLEIAPSLPSHAEAARASAAGVEVDVPVSPSGDEAVSLLLAHRSAGRSHRVALEVWDAAGELVAAHEVGLGVLRLAGPWLARLTVDGVSVLGASGEIIALPEAIQQAPRLAPCTLLDVTSVDGRVRVTTR